MSIINEKERKILSRGKTKLVTMIIPSRRRFNSLLKSIESIINTASDISNVEITIRFDYDDDESLSRLNELPFDKVDIYVIIGERFRGYIDLNKYINECCEISRGDFLFLFNDDSQIQSNGWDDVIEEYRDKIVVLNPKTGDDADDINTFPVISRKMFEITGHFSLQAHNDTWVSEVGEKLGIELVEDRIVIFHDRPDNPNSTGAMHKDTDGVTWEERTEMFKVSRPEFDTKKFTILRIEDIMKIKEFIP